MLDVLSWSPGALACYQAVRGRLNDDGTIYLGELISALTLDTLPGQSLLGRVLRDTTIWLALHNVTATKRPVPSRQDMTDNFSGFAFAVERIAREERSRSVGERHIAKRLVELGQNNAFGFIGLNPQPVYEEVRKLEVSLDLGEDELRGWHGMIDTNIILKSNRKFWEIDWRQATGVSMDFAYNTITIWLSTVLLHELDAIPTYHRDPDIKRKAAAFTAWLNGKLRTPRDVDLLMLAERVRIKFWRQPLTDSPPDSQHLEASRALRDRGVPIKVVTLDSEMRVRALAEGFEIFDLQP
jgi:PIN domain-containing protein